MRLLQHPVAATLMLCKLPCSLLNQFHEPPLNHIIYTSAASAGGMLL
jgi:hypothetical protein